ncbi:MAG: DUF4411 family protein [Candidatus Eremiobacteraeota bacterium]|nr:DUF4411 family protein [Candidatus Eremiobacteraeota bacterium]
METNQVMYTIDTSSIIHGWHEAYPKDAFPALWQKIEELIDDGKLIAIEEVILELEKKEDVLHKWAIKQEKLCVPIDIDIQKEVREILKSHKRLLDTRKNRSGADPFVIALAKVRKCTVITNEKKTSSQEKPHIPDVCEKLGIRCINLLELILEQGWIFR